MSVLRMDLWAAQPPPDAVLAALEPADKPTPAPVIRERPTYAVLRTLYVWCAQVAWEAHEDTSAAEVGRVASRTIAIVQAYMSRKDVDLKDLQLLGVAAASIAIKVEMDIPYEVTLEEFSNVTNTTYTADDVGRMQRDVLTELDFDVMQPTAHTFLDASLARNAADLPAGFANTAAAVLLVNQAYMPELCAELPPSLAAEGALVAAAAYLAPSTIASLKLINRADELRGLAHHMLRGQELFQRDDQLDEELRVFRVMKFDGGVADRQVPAVLGELPPLPIRATALVRQPSARQTSPSVMAEFRATARLNELGHGSFGTVYRLVVRENGRRVSRALKVMSNKFPEYGVWQQQVREVAALRLLGAHRSVVRAFRAEVSDAFEVYMELELVEQGSFNNWLARHRAEGTGRPGKDLSPAQQRRIAEGVLEGVAYMHSRSLMHCDIKDSNVLCSEDLAQIKLADFGGSMLCDNQHAQRRMKKGSIDYYAPEILLHKDDFQSYNYSFSADMWAVGALLLRAAHGKILLNLAESNLPPASTSSSDGLSAKDMASAIATVLGAPSPDAFDPEIAAELDVDLLVPLAGRNAPVRPLDGPDFVERLITKLLDYDPTIRPSAADCYAELTGTALDQPAPNTRVGGRALWRP